jgi:UDP-glucose 4-epimerase
MRCLVTGATGHLGAAIAQFLVAGGHDVAVLARPSSDPWRLAAVLDRVTVLRGDLADPGPAVEDVGRWRPEVVYHLAWAGVAGPDRDRPEQVSVNLVGGLKLFELAAAAGCHCWVGLGSQAEYGPYDRPLTEDLPPRPVTAYGVSKLALGLVTGKLCDLSGVRFVWLRMLATYGPMDHPGALIPWTIAHLLRGRRPALTSGRQRWDYLFVDDAAEAVAAAGLTPSVRGVFNLASGAAPTVRQIVERVRDLIDPALPLGLGERPDPPPLHLEADPSRLFEALGWRPRVSLDEGLRRTVDWYRQHPARAGNCP